jgi:hypothetical protein
LIATAADAQQRRSRATQQTIVCNERGCSDNITNRTRAAVAARPAALDANGNAVVLSGRPSGCPRRFCGCEASLYVFGKIRPELNLAANWIRRFRRAAPGPGMVAARSGHVMVLLSQVNGSEWLVHDGNSGGGMTRRHVRSIRGYVIVDPHAAIVAEQPAPQQRRSRVHSANASATAPAAFPATADY